MLELSRRESLQKGGQHTVAEARKEGSRFMPSPPSGGASVAIGSGLVPYVVGLKALHSLPLWI